MMTRVRARLALGLTAGVLAVASCQTNPNPTTGDAAAPPPAAGADSSFTSRPVTATQAEVYLTAQGTSNRLTRQAPVAFEAVPGGQPGEHTLTLYVDPKHAFQTMQGIGGAFTDAAAETFYKLPKAKQEELLTAYFDPEKGNGYSLGRTHIHSCDFSSESYTYIQDGDTTLNTFSIDHDRQYRLPFIKAALAKAGKITMYVSPWSPPAFMKTNGSMLHGGKIKPEYRRAWARYYSKFIKAYEQEGVPIWGLTVQNEPMAAQTWESCEYTGEEEASFVKNFLGPELEKSDLSRLKLMIWDHNRTLMYQRAAAVYNDPAAAKYVWGTAFHWYLEDAFQNVQLVHDAFPDKHLLFSEGCLYPFDLAKVDEWHWGETYGTAIINDLNNWTEGWTDWNLIVDEKGGPNHVQNYCYAPVVADTRTGQVHYMSSFYYLGHFSKFVRPGARRIACSSFSDELLTTAFRNTDGKIVVVAMNKTGEKLDYQVVVAGKAAKSTIPAHAIVSLII